MSLQARTCPHCGVEYYSKREETFKRHVKYCYKNPNLQYLFCELCSQKFTRPDNFKRHLAQQHTKKEEKKTIEEYESYDDDISMDDLFDIKENIVESHDPEFKETTFSIEFTRKAVNLATGGFLYQLFSRIIDHATKKCDFRNQKMLCQLSIENQMLQYPISTGIHKGNQFDLNQLFDRFDKVSQSTRLFTYDADKPEIILTVFQRKLY
jgi:hypothetical protein